MKNLEFTERYVKEINCAEARKDNATHYWEGLETLRIYEEKIRRDGNIRLAGIYK